MGGVGQYTSEELLIQYEPLIKTVYKKYYVYCGNAEDRLDLYSTIQLEFIQLVSEYDTRRGVDFPCYIKRMLNLRVLHYVTKCTDTYNKETLCEDVYATFPEGTETSYEFDKVEAFSSLDENIVLGDKQRQLLFDVLVNNKSLELIAKDEKTDIKVIRLRLHFLCKKLFNNSVEQEEYFAWKHGRTPERFADYSEDD
jgi:hypothetical protein